MGKSFKMRGERKRELQIGKKKERKREILLEFYQKSLYRPRNSPLKEDDLDAPQILIDFL